MKTKKEEDDAQQKKYEAEQRKVQQMRLFIEKNSAGTQATQAASREKELEKMIAAGLTEAVIPEVEVSFQFDSCGKLPPPVMAFENVKFHYPNCEEKLIYENVSLGVDCDSRVALVGPNGAGKSTLVKLMTGDIDAVDGAIKKHRYLKIAKFTQHSTEMLDLDMSALK